MTAKNRKLSWIAVSVFAAALLALASPARAQVRSGGHGHGSFHGAMHGGHGSFHGGHGGHFHGSVHGGHFHGGHFHSFWGFGFPYFYPYGYAAYGYPYAYPYGYGSPYYAPRSCGCYVAPY